jgi:hypothetical protein
MDMSWDAAFGATLPADTPRIGRGQDRPSELLLALPAAALLSGGIWAMLLSMAHLF